MADYRAISEGLRKRKEETPVPGSAGWRAPVRYDPGEMSRRLQQLKAERQEAEAPEAPAGTKPQTGAYKPQTGAYKPQTALDDHIGREMLTGADFSSTAVKPADLLPERVYEVVDLDALKQQQLARQAQKKPDFGAPLQQYDILQEPDRVPKAAEMVQEQGTEDEETLTLLQKLAARPAAYGRAIQRSAEAYSLNVMKALESVDTLARLGTNLHPTPLQQTNAAHEELLDLLEDRVAKDIASGKISEIESQTLDTATRMLPDTLLFLATGGGSEAAGMLGNPMFWTSLVQEYGGNYDELTDNGLDTWEAVKAALPAAAVNAGIEVQGGTEKMLQSLLGGIGKQGAAAVVKDYLVNSGEEALEELLQSPVSNAMAALTYDPEREVFNPEEMGKNAGMAFLSSLLLGGAAYGADAGFRAGAEKLAGRLEASEGGRQIQQQDGGASLLRAAKESDIPELMEMAEQYAGQLQKGKALSRGQLYELQQAERALGVEPVLSSYNRQAERRRAAAEAAFQDTEAQTVQETKAVRQEAERPASVRSEARQTAQQADGFAASLGEHGQAAWAEAVRDAESRGASSDLLEGAWKQYYSAGKYGKTMEWADRMDTAARQLITGDNIAKQAFQAGQLDAQAAAAADRAGKAQAAELRANRESGLFFDSGELKAQVDEDTRAALDSLGRAFGYRFEVGEMEVGNGSFDPSTGVIRLNAKAAGRTALVNVAKHEITHQMQAESPELYRQYKDFVAAALMERDGQTFEALVQQQIDLYARQTGVSLSREMAEDEVVANATELFLTDEESIRRLCEDNRTLGQKFLDLIRQVIRKVQKALSGAEVRQEATRLLAEDLDTLQQAEALWTRMLGGEKASEEAAASVPKSGKASLEGGKAERYQLKPKKRLSLEAPSESAAIFGRESSEEFERENVSVLPGAEIDRDGSRVRYNLDTFGEAERKKYLDRLVQSGVLTEAEAQELGASLDRLVSIIDMNREILDYDAAVTSDSEGNVTEDRRLFSPVKPNSDPLYRVSVDFSTLCRKRILTQRVVEELQTRLKRALTREEQLQIRKELEELRKELPKIDVACGLCYVEARRLLAGNQINRFLQNPEKALRDFFGKKNPVVKDLARKAIETMYADFNKEHGTRFTSLRQLENAGYTDFAARIRSTKHDIYQQYAAEGSEEMKAMMERGIRIAREQPEMFLSASGLAALKKSDPMVYDTFTTFVRNATKSKAQETRVPWLLGDSDKGISQKTIEAMNAENGLRSQSWSDFEIIHTLDYMQAVMELSSRGAKMHAYTKVPDYVRLMGKTGVMINLSMIAKGRGLDADGNLLYNEREGMGHRDMLELRKSYPETAGSILVCVSDEHILKAMQSDEVDYIIPYHASGLSKSLQSLALGAKWDDYTDSQNERYIGSLPAGERPDKPAFSEWGIPREGDNTEDGLGLMREMGDRYLQLCHERGYRPKFSQFLQRDENGLYHTIPGKSDNYWKLLIDRKMISTESGRLDGHYIRQQALKPVFDFATVEEMMNRALQDDTFRQNAEACRRVVEKFLRGGVKVTGETLKAVREMDEDLIDSAILEAGKELLQNGRYIGKAQEETRYQLEAGDDSPVVRKLERENSRLKAAVESLRQQFSLTRGVQVRASDVEKLAGKVIREYSSKADAGALSEKLKTVYDYLGNDPEPNWETVWGVVSEAARGVLEQSETVDRSLWNETKELRQRLRETKLYVSEEERGDFEADGGFAAFKRQNRGLRLTGERGDLSVDQLYTELCRQYPGWFDGESVSAYDQLCEITDFLEAVRPKPANPFGESLDEQADQLAGELFDAYFDIPQVKTYADKKQAQIDALRRKSRAELAALKQEQRERYERKLSEVKARYEQKLKDRGEAAKTREERLRYEKWWAAAAEKLAAKEKREQLRDRQQIAATRKKIERKVKSLSQALTKPTDKQNIPEGMRKAVQSLITSLDMTGKRGEDSKVSAAWAQLQQQVAAAVEDQSRAFPLDPELQERVNRLASEKVSLNDMTREQAEELYKALAALEKAARGVRAELRDGRKLESSEVAYSMIENLSRMKARPERESRVKAGLRNFFDYDLTDPVRFFKRFGAEGIYESLRDGQNQMISRWNEALRFTDGLLENDKAWKWQEETNTFRLESGEQLQLTVSQAMELYLLTRRKQALGHLLGGGITLKDREQGGRIYRGGNYQLTVTDLESITKSLSSEQKRVADRMGEYLSGTVSEWGNGVTMELYGYRKFTEKHYWPISSDQNYQISQFDGQQRDASLANLGMTKQTKEGASAALVLGDAFTTFSRHVSQMAAYSAFLPRMERISAVFNWKTSHNGNYRSVKQALERVGGKGAVQYWDSLLRDINGGGRIERSPGERWMGRIKAGSIAGNLRVVVQQPTAYLRASAMISPKYLAKGLVSRGGAEEMKIYAPIARWKDWGYFEAGNGRQLEELVLGRHGALNRVQDASMAPAGAMDNLTWGRIWAAVKLEIADTTDLTPGSEEFLQAAGRRFSQIIDETQVVDSVLHRTQIMRSKNDLVKMSTAFMSEPLKNLNLCMEAVDRVRQARGLQEKLREAPHLLRVTAAFVSTAVVNALMVSLVDAGRDDDDDETWAQKYAQALLGDYEADMGAMERIRAALGANLTDNLNPLGMIPYMKDALSLFEGYDIKRMDMQGLTDVASSLLKWVPYASGGSRYRASYLIRDTASSLSKAFGLPMANFIREFGSLINLSLTVLDDFGQDTTAFRYWLSRQTLDLANSSNKGLFVSYLLEARMSGNTELATRIYNDLLEAGWSGDKLEQAMTERAKKLLEGYAPQLEAYNAALESGDAEGMDEASGELLAEGFTAAEIQKAAKALRGSQEDDEPEEGASDPIEEDYWEQYGASKADFDVSFAAEALVNGNRASWKEAEKALLDAGKTQAEIDGAMKSELKKRILSQMGYEKIGDLPEGVYLDMDTDEYRVLSKEYGYTQFGYTDCVQACLGKTKVSYGKMVADMVGKLSRSGKKFTRDGIEQEVKEQLLSAYKKGRYEKTASSSELAAMKRALLRLGVSGALVEEKCREYEKRKG